MALTTTPPGELGSPAHPFRLKDFDGRTWSLESFWNARALVVVFMCNHCPYVKAVVDRIQDLAREYAPRGVALVAINPNDAVKYPDDSAEAMRELAREKGFVFPYLIDETQEVARAYGAVCTPDFYVYARQSDWRLAYRGRLDDSWKDPSQVKARDLALAIEEILSGRMPSAEQKPSMGCSIKWK